MHEPQAVAEGNIEARDDQKSIKGDDWKFVKDEESQIYGLAQKEVINNEEYVSLEAQYVKATCSPALDKDARDTNKNQVNDYGKNLKATIINTDALDNFQSGTDVAQIKLQMREDENRETQRLSSCRQSSDAYKGRVNGSTSRDNKSGSQGHRIADSFKVCSTSDKRVIEIDEQIGVVWENKGSDTVSEKKEAGLTGAEVRWFSEHMEISKGCNTSFVTLIPNVVDPIGLGDFRPISLIGYYYKIIAKLLAERLKKVVPKLVEDKKKGLIFKVDFEKTYDSVSWSFLGDIMETMGFGCKWRKWIMTCLNSALMSILVNGSPIDEFVLERGIRQGDLLSPFLFILAAEGLNAIISEAMSCGDKGNAQNLMCILKCFKNMAGLKVNLNKSKLYGVGLDHLEVESMARWMRCGVSDLPFTYLGLPIRGFMKLEPWLPVWVKLDKRGIDMDSLFCPHCEDGVESIDHAFIFCNMASTVWSKVFNWWKLGPVNAFTSKEILLLPTELHERFLSYHKLSMLWISSSLSTRLGTLILFRGSLVMAVLVFCLGVRVTLWWVFSSLWRLTFSNKRKLRIF
ncbi:RNA-directed DNA polymerase, eukaryota, reverse transcriptase zinc-binding domain protein [Tanacetum coccineum]